MPQDELTNNRPKAYSRWHRLALPDWCYQTDGDFFEQRTIEGRLCVVAYIETIQIESPKKRYRLPEYDVWPSKRSLLNSILREWGIKCYVVYHNQACTEFVVIEWATGKVGACGEAGYIKWLTDLVPL